MISFEEALNIVLSVNNFRISYERAELSDSLNRILGEDILSDMDIPPFHKSAMDGYACRNQDIANKLEVIEMIPAGKIPEKKIGKNQCSKIMTGGMVPEGADCVIIIEDVQELGNNTIQYVKTQTSANICYKGEDIEAKEIVLKKGTIIKPQHLGELASVGCSRPFVTLKPQIAIISTGDEIVEPYQQPKLSQIRNSNAYQLIGQIQSIGGIASYRGIVPDDEAKTIRAIETTMEKSDVIISTGAVSAGDFDLIPKVLEKLDFTIHFHHLAVQPGKPTLFAQKNNKFFFGLPGNPVSSFIQFEVLVKPFIYRILGTNYEPVVIKLPFAVDYQRKKSEKKAWIPIKIHQHSIAMPVDYHGSAHLFSLTGADGVISVNIGVNTIKKGELVDVRLF
jgi:molybdopterin molybdotransferase